MEQTNNKLKAFLIKRIFDSAKKDSNTFLLKFKKKSFSLKKLIDESIILYRRDEVIFYLSQKEVLDMSIEHLIEVPHFNRWLNECIKGSRGFESILSDVPWLKKLVIGIGIHHYSIPYLNSLIEQKKRQNKQNKKAV